MVIDFAIEGAMFAQEMDRYDTAHAYACDLQST
jgi:hypothetical protein